MAQLSNSFEGGTDGVTITTGNSGGTSGDAWSAVNLDSNTVEYDTAIAAHGSVSARIATGGSSGTPYLTWTAGVSGTQLYARAYFYLTANPSGNTNLLRFLVSTTIIATVRVNSAGKVGLLYSGGTLAEASSASVPLNQWFRIELRAVANTATGAVEARCYLGADPDSTTITETLSASNVNTGSSSAMDRVRVGLLTATTDYTIGVDDVAWADTTWPGPAGGGGSSASLGTASETDTAQALGRTKTAALGVASETSASQALTRTKTQALSLAAETSTPQAIASTKARALGTATSTETAQPLAGTKAKALPVVGATETAQALTIASGFVHATETSTAQPLSGAKTRALQPASEATQAQPLGGSKRATLNPGSETDEAQAMHRAKTRTLGAAAATDTAQALGPIKRLTLGTAVETGAAQGIVGRKTGALGVATETSMARALVTEPDGPPLNRITVGTPRSRWANHAAPHGAWTTDTPRDTWAAGAPRT